VKKIIVSTFIAAIVELVLLSSSASAFTCYQSWYGVGCRGRHGGWGITRDGAVAMGPHGNIYAYQRGGHFYAYHHGSACYWHNGEHICP
jgi:hypothetical protein